MGLFEGKKLLVLGTSVGSVEIVKYAKEEGAYVIVTDYLPIEKSAAKQYADETEMISTLDAEALCEFARQKHIDGVFCGVSEANLVSVNKIAKELNLPCYFTDEQWELLENKDKFKSLCCEYNVPVAKKINLSDELSEDELNAIEYPVIIKPVDQSSAIGIHICHNKDELIEGYKDAVQKSYCGEAIVEQYIVGDEFSAAYTVINGEYRLSMMGDKYLNREQEGFIPLPEAYVYPSKHLDVYMNEINSNVIKMFKSIGLENGTVFIQGVTNGSQWAVFEAGLRMGGTALFRFIDQINHINILKLLVNYQMLGKMGGDLSLEDPYLKGKRCCLLSLLNAGGEIAQINGFDEANKIDGVVESVVRYKVGETIAKTGTLKQSHIRFFVVRDSAYELKKSVQDIQKIVKVVDKQGKNMLLSPFDTENLLY